MEMRILSCNCDGFLGNKAGANFQDSQYGKGKRAHNPITSKDKTFRCTICRSEQTKGDTKS